MRVAPERAFEAFVRVSEVLAWLADGAVIGARPGGNWALGWYADPDSDAGYSSIGQIETFEPGRALVVSNLVFSSPEGTSFGPMRLAITFEAVEEGTDVTVVQEGIEEGPVLGFLPRPARPRLGADALGPQGLARGRRRSCPGAEGAAQAARGARRKRVSPGYFFRPSRFHRSAATRSPRIESVRNAAR